MTKKCLFVALVWLWCLPLSAAPPEFGFVGPTLTREQWIERFRNRDRNGNRGRGRGGDRDRPTPDVGLYDKLELNAELLATYTNPFDPDEIDLWAEFTSPSGKVKKIWGFYNPARRSMNWMVRFSPTETGTWKYQLHVRDREGTADSPPGLFRCVESERHGFVTIASNKRYLRHSDDTSFYGIGMWYNDEYGGRGQGFITEANLDGLKDRGVNFISFYHVPLETIATGLGRYDLDRCARLDEIFAWCEARDLAISWNLVFHDFLSKTIWQSRRWDENPYNTIVECKDFYGWKYQEKLYRYVIARWGYSRALFQWHVIDEINGTDGWVHNEAAAVDWCRKMNDFLHAHDPHRRPTVGTQSGGVGQDWPEGNGIFDIAAREIYEAQGHSMPPSNPDPFSHHPLGYSNRTYAAQIRKLWDGFEKPAIIAECGWDHTYYEPGTPGYLAMHHNVLWVSLANGACATPFWWAYWPRMNESVVTRDLNVLADFVSDVDFAGSQWQPIDVDMSVGAGWAMRSDNLVFGWVVNPATGVANQKFTISGFDDGDYRIQFVRTWGGRDPEAVIVAAENGKLTVTIPELVSTDSHANNIGDDVAFKITNKNSRQRRLADQ